MQAASNFPNKTLTGISSMATRAVLADLIGAYAKATGNSIAIESVGGVDAAKRVQAGEAFDAVFLAADAIDKLIASGHVLVGSRVDLMRSGVSVAVRKGAVQPSIATEAALMATVLAASSIGYSTGPSGVALIKLFERWGIAPQIQSRLVQATPGVPVGSMVANGTVALGFQQTSELLNLPGIAILGPLPESVQIVTTFSAGVCATSQDAATVQELLAYMAGPDCADAKRRQGMEPA
ncbi:substrate-binding domain-containing protein [Candidatus Aalborgicola defluviihabitans]|uniref:substrate-binding domain-containing protein n=1 Tax=Candidatus Aalborgicola defluviihabitans TaxID=3386187 RepID=UPI0039B9AD93